MQAIGLVVHGAQLTVTDTVFRDNDNAIVLYGVEGARAVQIDRCRIVGNLQYGSTGLQVSGGNRLNILSDIGPASRPATVGN